MKRIALILAILVLAAVGGTAWWLLGANRPQRQLVLYGDVDLRQVDLAFDDTGRIADVYVQEGDRVHRGEVLARLDTSRLPASIAIDSFPDQRFRGWVGFVSPVAEFTPKNVETEELCTSLVYEVRAFVKDPSDQLHLGSPATVSIAINGPLPGPPPGGSLAAVARAQP